MSDGQASTDRQPDALAMSLRTRVLELTRAEERLASFAFHEDGPGRPAGRPTDAAWAVHLARALHAATEPAALDLLVSLRREARTVDEIALTAHPRGDRLAAGAWIGDLAAAGLLSRDLESDRVSLAPLGAAIVDLVENTAATAGGPVGPIGDKRSAAGARGGAER